MNNKIFLSCDNATHTCDKAQYNEVSLWGKIKLTIHLAYCSACRKYSKNNSKLTTLLAQKPTKLDAAEKSKLKSAFEQELAKQNNK